MAVPLRDSSGQVVAALTVTGPSLRLPPDRIQHVLPLLLSAAHKISRRLGYRGDSAITNDGGSE